MKSDKSEQDVEKIIVRIAESVFINDDGITIESTYDDTVGWDSLGTLNLIMAIEEEFGVQFSEDELENIESLDDIYNAVLEKHAGG